MQPGPESSAVYDSAALIGWWVGTWVDWQVNEQRADWLFTQAVKTAPERFVFCNLCLATCICDLSLCLVSSMSHVEGRKFECQFLHTQKIILQLQIFFTDVQIISVSSKLFHTCKKIFQQLQIFFTATKMFYRRANYICEYKTFLHIQKYFYTYTTYFYSCKMHKIFLQLHNFFLQVQNLYGTNLSP